MEYRYIDPRVTGAPLIHPMAEADGTVNDIICRYEGMYAHQLGFMLHDRTMLWRQRLVDSNYYAGCSVDISCSTRRLPCRGIMMPPSERDVSFSLIKTTIFDDMIGKMVSRNVIKIVNDANARCDPPCIWDRVCPWLTDAELTKLRDYVVRHDEWTGWDHCLKAVKKRKRCEAIANRTMNDGRRARQKSV
jgi:hypothetical protein